MTDPEHMRILMMGHLDGELDDEQEAEFQAWLRGDPQAGKELAEYRKLHDLAQGIRLKEPQDYEWDRFWSVLYNRMERRVGAILVATGALGLVIAAGVWLMSWDALPGWLRVPAGLLGIGLTLLFLNVLRGRLRGLPYDRYREVKR